MFIPHNEALFTTEIRILAENASYFVIAIRIDKDVIARNLPWLAALADHAVPAEPHAQAELRFT